MRNQRSWTTLHRDICSIFSFHFLPLSYESTMYQLPNKLPLNISAVWLAFPLFSFCFYIENFFLWKTLKNCRRCVVASGLSAKLRHRRHRPTSGSCRRECEGGVGGNILFLSSFDFSWASVLLSHRPPSLATTDYVTYVRF